jgi:competence protein ComEC
MRQAVTERIAEWLDAERAQLVLWLPAFIAVGVALYYALRFEPPPWVGLFSVSLSVASALVVRRLRLLLIPLAALSIGFASAQIATAGALPQDADLPRNAVVVGGPLLSVEPLPDGRRIAIQPARLDDASGSLARVVRIRLRRGDDTPLAAGDQVRVRALIRPPASPAFPGAWDFQRTAFYTGLGASGYALGPVEVTTQAVTPATNRFVQSLREIITRRILAVMPGAAGGISVSFMTGSALAIPASDYSAFKDSGLMHLLSVSGFHIVVASGSGWQRLGSALH